MERDSGRTDLIGDERRATTMSIAPVNILLVEDHPGDAQRCREMLEAAQLEFSLRHADRVFAAIEAIRHEPPDVILLDLFLPDSEGLDTVRRVHDAAARVPIVVMTADGDEVLAMKAIQAGAQEYLIKGSPSSESLVRCIRYSIERKRSEEQFRCLVEAATDAVVVSDAKGTITLWNRASEAIFGYTAAEALGQPLTLIMPSEFHGQAFERAAATAQGGLPGGGTVGLTVRRKDGGEVPVELSLATWTTGQGRFVAGILRDVSEHRQAQESNRQRALLEARAEALAQAKEAAESANRGKSEFLATMSHELRTPLNGIIGMTELLLGTELDERQRRYAWLAKTSGSALLGLINDILDFSKIEAGRVELEMVTFDLRHVIELIADSFSSQASGKGLTLTASVHPHAPSQVRGDLGRLQQVMRNLVSNAIKFTDSGQVFIRAAPEHETPATVTLRVSVSDTGIGIPLERRDRLFKPFSQVDASTTRRYGGTGLGLAICKRLLDLMGGQIGVESEPGRGSTFWFTVVLQRAGAQPRECVADLRALNILVVDDDATNRLVLQVQLSAWGFDNDGAPDAGRALAMLQERAASGRPFNLAFLKMHVAGQSALDLAGSIKADASIQDTVMVLLAARGEGDVEALMTAGFSACLNMPARPWQVLDAVVEAVTCARARPPDTRSEMRPAGGLPDGRGPNASRGRILLVEDHEISQEVAVAFLHRGGYDCEVAANGRAAFDAVQGRQFDLVLMDCQMPEVDGFEASRLIRRWEAHHTAQGRHLNRLPIIALTANAIKGDRERCLEAGMDDYLAKPLDPDRLLAMIEARLRSGREPQVCAAGVPEARRAAPGESPPIDAARLRDRWAGYWGIIDRMLRKFEAQARGDFEQIVRSTAAGDAKHVALLAHGLKGAAGYVAADRLREAAERLEAMARCGNLGGAERCAEKLGQELRTCLDYLPSLLAAPEHDAHAVQEVAHAGADRG